MLVVVTLSVITSGYFQKVKHFKPVEIDQFRIRTLRATFQK